MSIYCCNECNDIAYRQLLARKEKLVKEIQERFESDNTINLQYLVEFVEKLEKLK